MLEILTTFEVQLRSDEKNYDVASSWVGVWLVRQTELGGLYLDKKEWEDDILEDDVDGEGNDFEDDSDDAPTPMSSAATHALAIPAALPTSASSPLRKLRPASDVLHRILWDPHLDPAEYIVGYEDRFVGTREMPVSKWRTEQTDDEFVPLHRILYFRRQGTQRRGQLGRNMDADSEEQDGVVWDRRRRIDILFGSGLGRG